MAAATIAPRFYYLVFAALILLTGATVGLSFVHGLEEWHGAIGLTIAAAKGLLIFLIFMHALQGPPIIWLVALSGLFWLGIMMALTMADYLSRAWSLQ